jgi:putative Mg2+ transporter-C (MgtC) family protein
MEALSDVEAVQRLALAMVVGAVLGIERERLDRPAGLRTYMLVTEGACLFMICAILLAEQIVRAGGISDPGRIASTVVQGIGFIAAGVILTA